MRTLSFVLALAGALVAVELHGCSGGSSGFDAGPADSGSSCTPNGCALCSGYQIQTVAQLRGAVPANLGNAYEIDCAVVTMVSLGFVNDAGVPGASNLWIQDQAGGPQSGINLFFNPQKGDVLPSSIQEGDVVSVIGTIQVASGITSATKTHNNGRLEIAFSSANPAAGAKVVKIQSGGTVPLAVQLADSDLQPGATTSLQYVGQKVRVTAPVNAVDGTNSDLACGSFTCGFALGNAPAGDGTLVVDDFSYYLDGHNCDIGSALRADAGNPVPLANGVVGLWETYLSYDAGMVHGVYPFRCNQILQGAE
jgi:hypothetical protein